MQKLILPINDTNLTASMGTQAYINKFGFGHYGIDMASASYKQTLYGSGGGTVIDCGWDNVCGNIVIIQYTGAFNHRTGKSQDVVFRYMHLHSIHVVKGQKINSDTVLGLYGNTGQLNMANHLHLECDLDIRNPHYTPTVRASNFLKGTALGATSNTLQNPIDYLHIDTNQSYRTVNDIYIKVADKTIPKLSKPVPKPPENTVSLAEYEKVKKERDSYKIKLDQIKKIAQ